MCSTRATSRLGGYTHAEYSGGRTAAVVSALTSVAPLDSIEEVSSYGGGGESMTLNFSPRHVSSSCLLLRQSGKPRTKQFFQLYSNCEILVVIRNESGDCLNHIERVSADLNRL